MRDMLRTSWHSRPSCRTSGGASASRTEKHGLPRIDHLRQRQRRCGFCPSSRCSKTWGQLDLDGIHWVIVGGESGPGARPMQQDWVRRIRDQCSRPNVPFFFKQWGGVRKAKAGRELDGATCDGVPPPSQTPPLDDTARKILIAEVTAWPLIASA